MFSKIFFLTVLSLPIANAALDQVDQSTGRDIASVGGSRRTIIDLVKSGYYFSTLPMMKDYIVKNERSLDGEMDSVLDTMLYHTGVRPFESLPVEVLKKSRSSNVRYILAKRLFKKGQNQDALNELNSIPGDHASYPFVANLKATIHSALNNHREAETQFRDCVRASERRIDRVESLAMKNQLQTNRDFCIAGVARVHFATEDYKKADLGYLDISKDSFVWPEILFEEAWTSYYMKNYNRTLGKLVSYKAPVFDFVFKPEVEVLKALTFMKMCLYDDAKKTVDDFYSKLLNPSRDLRSFLIGRGKDYRYFYSLMADHEENRSAPIPIVDQILKSVRKEAAFIEMKSALIMAMGEYNKLSKNSNSTTNEILERNVKTVVDEYRSTIGAFVRAGLLSKYAELYSAFQGMSYIKLEVLAQRKERLYQTDVDQSGKRGDVKYIERNDKQYFWTFNGEFWADELGDYVFALGSEC
jgi:tetratricopeptide (TPR) repeat protein